MVQFMHRVKSTMSRFFQPNHSNKPAIIKSAIIASTIAVTLSIGSVYASNGVDDSKDVDTVYHIYHKEELLGTVSDKAVIDNIVKEKVKEAKSTYQNYDFSVKDQISYIPEKVYTPVYDNEEAIKKIKTKLDVLAKAEAIMVDGKAVAFVSNEEEVEKVINKLKMKYVPEEVLTKLPSSPNGVKFDDFIYKDVHLAQKVTSSEGKVFPEDILSVDNAVQFLLKGTLQQKKHVIKEGEVLGQIADNYDLSLKQLVQLNPGLGENDLIQIGDELNVTAYKPLVTVNVEMEAVRNEVIPFEIEVVEDKNIFKGTTKVKQEGANGQKVAKYSIVRVNGAIAKKVITEETVVKNPTKKIIVKGTKVTPSRGTGDLSWPTVGGYISSPMGYRWGKQHKGIDIARPSNRNILAADNGTVVSAGWDGGYGNKIVISHNNGVKTVYGHLAKINVKVGQVVSKGQKIGIMGSTGHSTGLHLHFEVYKNGKLENPKREL